MQCFSSLHPPSRMPDPTPRLLRPSDPRILPGYGKVLVVPSEADVGSVAVTDLDGLRLADWKGTGSPDARAGLPGRQVADAVQGGDASPPEIAVDREPS